MIEAGWVTVADEPDYADNTVARVTDHVRTHIAASSTRGEDQLEKQIPCLELLRLNV